MTSMWDFREGAGRAGDDVVGYDVEATDGSIGKIDEASDRGRVGVPGGRHRVLDLRQEADDPGRLVDRVDDEQAKVYVGMSKDDIKVAPDFNDEDRHVRDSYDTYYEPFGRRS